MAVGSLRKRVTEQTSFGVVVCIMFPLLACGCQRAEPVATVASPSTAITPDSNAKPLTEEQIKVLHNNPAPNPLGGPK